jgi:uncharacterized repeat protein (TIGR01451 family)
MTQPGRSILLMLPALLLALPMTPEAASGRAGPFRTAQVVQPGPAVEPPLADGQPPTMPRADPLGQTGAPPPQFAPPRAPVDPPVPQVSVKVRVAAQTSSGKELEYRILVENAGQAPAHQVYVRAAVPTNAEFVRSEPEPTTREPELRWKLDSLAAFGKREIRLTVRPTGAGDVRFTARVVYEHGQTVVTRLGKPDLQLRLSAPDRLSINDMKPVTIEVTNLGQAPALNVVVTPKVPDGLAVSRTEPPIPADRPVAWELGTLEPGKSRTVKFDLVAKKPDQFVLKVDADADGGLHKEASATLLVGEAKLSLEMTGPQRRMVGTAAEYQIVVGNPGTMPAGNVIVEDVLPSPIQFVSAVPTPQGLPYQATDAEGKAVRGVRLRWLLSTLAPGERRTLRLTVRVVQGDGEFRHRVAARGDRGLTADAEVKTQFEGASGLTVEIDKNPDPLTFGQTARYRLRVRNRGTGAATNVRLDVTLPEPLRLGDSGGPTTGRAEGSVVRFDPLARLEAGAEIAWMISAQAPPTGEPKVQVRLRVDLIADQLEPGKPLRTEENITIVTPP